MYKLKVHSPNIPPRPVPSIVLKRVRRKREAVCDELITFCKILRENLY